MKRIMVASFFGLIMGAVCATGAFSAKLLSFSAVTLVWILLNRAVMGFVIGVSGLKLHWAVNGIVMGLAVGSIFSFFMFMTIGSPVVPILNFFVNGIFGLIIEFFTTVVFKAPSIAERRSIQRTAAA